MKKAIAIAAILVLFSAPASADWKDQFRNQNPYATKTDQMPSRMQRRFDYSGTTSGYPIYSGWAAPSVAASSALWRICKATDGANGPTLIQCADDVAWDDRAAGVYT